MAGRRLKWRTFVLARKKIGGHHTVSEAYLHCPNDKNRGQTFRLGYVRFLSGG